MKSYDQLGESTCHVWDEGCCGVIIPRSAYTSDRDTKQPVKTASAPFNEPAADLILRTTDNVDFHIHSVILRLCSSHFPFLPGSQHKEDSLSAAVESKEPQSFPETSVVLDRMLRFCYPCADPEIKNLDQLCDVIAAMARHSMEDCISRPGALLLKDEFLRQSPLRVFAVAYHHGWKDIAKAAAQTTLRLSLSDVWEHPLPAELRMIPSTAMIQLFQYRSQCCEAAAEAAFHCAGAPTNHVLSNLRVSEEKCLPECDDHSAKYDVHDYAMTSMQRINDSSVLSWSDVLEEETMTYSWLWEFCRDVAQLLTTRPRVRWDNEMITIFEKYQSIAFDCEICQVVGYVLDGRHFENHIEAAINNVKCTIFD